MFLFSFGTFLSVVKFRMQKRKGKYKIRFLEEVHGKGILSLFMV